MLCLPWLSHCTQPLVDIQLYSMSSLIVPLYSASSRYPTVFYVFPSCPTVLSLSYRYPTVFYVFPSCPTVFSLFWISYSNQSFLHVPPCTQPFLDIQLYSVFHACPTVFSLFWISNCIQSFLHVTLYPSSPKCPTVVSLMCNPVRSPTYCIPLYSVPSPSPLYSDS